MNVVCPCCRQSFGLPADRSGLLEDAVVCPRCDCASTLHHHTFCDDTTGESWDHFFLTPVSKEN